MSFLIAIKPLIISKLSDYEKLKSIIKKTHINDDAIEEMKKYIGLKCNKVIIEYPYADKDYLSTFYIHYSRKYKEFSKKCYRIHFFNNDYYFGFIILRPTFYKKIGRTYLFPQLLLEGDSYVMTGKYKLNLLGSEAFIESFPWMHQETDISTCSHVAVWSILRYFGNKYRYYSDMTMGEVFEKVQLNFDRKVPSKGLSYEQISNLLTQFGFSTLIRHKNMDSSKSRQYLGEIFAYIESGLPLIAVSSSMEHAVCVIGHGPIINKKLNSDQMELYFEKSHDGKPLNALLHSRFIDSVIVNDDNYFPFRTVCCNFMEGTSTDNLMSYTTPNYTIDAFDYFIIPLYEKMHLTYNEVYNRVINLLESGVLKNLPSPLVLRIFITSSNSYKEKVNNYNNMHIYIKKNILELNMPKFIWCVELSGIDNYYNNLVDGTIIIDATSSSKDDEPWIFMHDKKSIKYYNGNRLVRGNLDNVSPYCQYTNNLEGYKI